MSLTREQIGAIQDEAGMAEIMFLCQMALEGDSDAWHLVETLHEAGKLSAQAVPRNNTG